MPEPDEPDPPKAPLYGARPLLAVVPGDAPASAASPAEPAAADGDCGDGGYAPGLPVSSPPHANGMLGGSSGLGSPGPASPAGLGFGAGGAGVGGAMDRVSLYSLRKHCYARELTFGGRVLPVMYLCVARAA